MLEAPNLFRTRYTDEFVMDFERGVSGSKLLATVNTRGTVQGDTVKFDLVDPGDEMVEKGRDGRIPASDLGLSQLTATWKRRHKKFQIDDFDVWRGNPNSVKAMQERGLAACNRQIDQTIVDQLDAATNACASPTILSTLAEVSKWVETLANNDVDIDDGNVFGVISHRAWSQMLRIPEFKSSDYTEVKVMDRAYSVKMKTFLGVNWMKWNGLTGKTTSSSKCYLYHRSAIGHMLVEKVPQPIFFTNDEDEYAGVRYRVTDAAKLCLQRGVIQYVHNDTTALTA